MLIASCLRIYYDQFAFIPVARVSGPKNEVFFSDEALSLYGL